MRRLAGLVDFFWPTPDPEADTDYRNRLRDPAYVRGFFESTPTDALQLAHEVIGGLLKERDENPPR